MYVTINIAYSNTDGKSLEWIEMSMEFIKLLSMLLYTCVIVKHVASLDGYLTDAYIGTIICNHPFIFVKIAKGHVGLMPMTSQIW